jgi:carboxylesterase type B
MDNGSIFPADPVDSGRAQNVYDAVVATAGCSSAADTLACLRTLDYQAFLNAANSAPSISSYTSLALSYLARPDGKVLTQSPDLLAKTGKFAKVPFIIGDQEDEGTLFSLFQENVTTTDQLIDYMANVFYPESPRSVSEGLVATYPDDITAGSPYRTGLLNNFYPQFKRLAAILGDTGFNLMRRILLGYSNSIDPSVPSWSYLASYGYGTPILGTVHASDIFVDFGFLPGFPQISIQSYYLSFINTLDPNSGTVGLPYW